VQTTVSRHSFTALWHAVDWLGHGEKRVFDQKLNLRPPNYTKQPLKPIRRSSER
jgi:hypothetical protein